MEEISSLKRQREEIIITQEREEDINIKRQKSYKDIITLLEEEEDLPNEALSSLISTLQEEISSPTSSSSLSGSDPVHNPIRLESYEFDLDSSTSSFPSISLSGSNPVHKPDRTDPAHEPVQQNSYEFEPDSSTPSFPLTSLSGLKPVHKSDRTDPVHELLRSDLVHEPTRSNPYEFNPDSSTSSFPSLFSGQPGPACDPPRFPEDPEYGPGENVMRHLLEASDDELGLLPNTSNSSNITNGYDEVVGHVDGGDLFCPFVGSESIWEFEEHEAVNYYSLSSEIFM